MPQKTAAIIGATGLIGSHLLSLLEEDNRFETIRVLVRRPVNFKHPKLEIKFVAFDDYESVKLAIDGCDTVFCAIGTTLKKMKSDKLAYRKIDYDIPVAAARASLETGVQNFVLISSVGANAGSKNFYLGLKGEVEEAVQKFPIPSITILRPSMLLGHREEKRTGEKIFQGISKALAPLLFGSLKKYRPIHAKKVAATMLKAATENKKGARILEYDGMVN